MNKKKLVFILTVGVLLLVVVKTNYKEINNENIISDSINYKQDFKSLAMYKNDGNGDVEITTMPESGYEINKEKSYCTTDNINKVYNKMYTDENGNHIITGLEKDSKCYIFFDKSLCSGSACKTILGNVTVNEGTPDFSKAATTDEGIFKAQDDDGTSYYWRGAVTNNYVKFANKYWRIIRINGDGTIRMIYQGTAATSTGTSAQIGTSAFNTSNNNNMYVGFKYTSGQVHGIGTKSTILKTLETWYNNNFSSYTSKLDTSAGFCGDRTPYTNTSGTASGGGTGTTITYYGAYIRLLTNNTPVITCLVEDLYTLSEATKGNKSLEKPIGLITADEVAMAGGIYRAVNSNYYLYTGQTYWTISPSHTDANVFYVNSNGNLSVQDLVSVERGVRPVINLKADVTLTGTGTASDPYVVV